jgi:hypothetical protein
VAKAESLPHAPVHAGKDSYARYWGLLLQQEYREAADELKQKRSKWSRARLEASGLGLFGASATPETDLFGEKIVRVSKPGSSLRLADRFSRGDILILSPDDRSPRLLRNEAMFFPRECCVVETGDDWLTVGVGKTWPVGLWEARRQPGSFGVVLDRAVPQAALLAQQEALQLVRRGAAGEAASLLASTCISKRQFKREAAALPPVLEPRELHEPSASSEPADTAQLKVAVRTAIRAAIRTAIDDATKRGGRPPNQSQEDAVAWALGRRLSLIRGPPGTGKTRTAALLISSALRLKQGHAHDPPPARASQPGRSSQLQSMRIPMRILAVAHSNGAADVLLSALLRIGVPAVRAVR